MRYVAACLLAGLGGNENPTQGDIEAILGSVGIEANSERLARVLKELSGKNLEEIMAAGKDMLATIGTSSTAPQAPPEAATADLPKEVEVKEEKKEETEESDDDLGFGLFD